MEAEFLEFYPQETFSVEKFNKRYHTNYTEDSVKDFLNCGEELYERYVIDFQKEQENPQSYDVSNFDLTADNYDPTQILNDEDFTNLGLLHNLFYSAFSPNVKDKLQQVKFRKIANKAIARGANIEAVRLTIAKYTTRFMETRQANMKQEGEHAKAEYLRMFKNITAIEGALSAVRSPYDDLLDYQMRLNQLKRERNILEGKGDYAGIEKLEETMFKVEDKIAGMASQMDPQMLKHVMEEKQQILQEESKQLELCGKKPIDVANSQENIAMLDLKRLAMQTIKKEQGMKV